MKKLTFLVVMMLASPALADVTTIWRGDGWGGDGVSYGDALNWTNGLPDENVSGSTVTGTYCAINNGDTVTVDVTGVLAGRGRYKYLKVGFTDAVTGLNDDGHILLVAGGEITGMVRFGEGTGRTGTGLQTGGNWLQRGWIGTTVYGDSEFSLGQSAGCYGRYELVGGNLGGVPGSDMSDDGWGLGRFRIGNAGVGEFIQHPGTYVQCRGGYWVVLGGAAGGQGTYTMHGGTLRANTFMFSEYSGALSATWNITSTDVDIVLGASREPYSGRWTGIKLGHTVSSGDVRCYWSAPEGLSGQTGLAGQTVQIEIVGGLFRNLMYGAAGRDADVAGLNNITIKFTKQSVDPAYPNCTFEVAGANGGPNVARLTNNFALEGLIVGGEGGGDDAAYLLLVDAYDNMADGTSNEVLYTNILTVNPGSFLLLGGRTLYYYKSTGPALVEGVNYILDGGALIPIPWIAGDINWDVRVDWIDFTTLRGNYGMTVGATWADGDLDGDGDVDWIDYTTLRGNYGAPVPPGAVPEPITLTLLGLGGLALIRRRRSQ